MESRFSTTVILSSVTMEVFSFLLLPVRATTHLFTSHMFSSGDYKNTAWGMETSPHHYSHQHAPPPPNSHLHSCRQNYSGLQSPKRASCQEDDKTQHQSAAVMRRKEEWWWRDLISAGSLLSASWFYEESIRLLSRSAVTFRKTKRFPGWWTWSEAAVTLLAAHSVQQGWCQHGCKTNHAFIKQMCFCDVTVITSGNRR